MKKALLATALIAVIAFASCGGSPKATATGPDELDATIREAADYLNTRIPSGNKTAFINISGGYPDLSDYILSDLSKHAVNDGVFSVVDRAQLDAVRAELNFSWSGEVDDNSAQEIGKMLGAQTIVSGSVRKIGALYRLDIRAIAVQTAEVQGQWNKNIPNGATIAALTITTASGANVAGGSATGGRASTGSGTTSGTGGSGTTQTVTPAQPPAPVLKNGTYTLNPRPRVREAGGRWVDMWISKVEVETRFITFYFENVERGAGRGYGESSHNDWYTGNVALYNLDNENVYVMSTGITIARTIYPETVIFPRVNFNRFRMETKAYGRDKGFEEIILGEPDE